MNPRLMTLEQWEEREEARISFQEAKAEAAISKLEARAEAKDDVKEKERLNGIVKSHKDFKNKLSLDKKNIKTLALNKYNAMQERMINRKPK